MRLSLFKRKTWRNWSNAPCTAAAVKIFWSSGERPRAQWGSGESLRPIWIIGASFPTSFVGRWHWSRWEHVAAAPPRRHLTSESVSTYWALTAKRQLKTFTWIGHRSASETPQTESVYEPSTRPVGLPVGSSISQENAKQIEIRPTTCSQYCSRFQIFTWIQGNAVVWTSRFEFVESEFFRGSTPAHFGAPSRVKWVNWPRSAECLRSSHPPMPFARTMSFNHNVC